MDFLQQMHFSKQNINEVKWMTEGQEPESVADLEI